MDGQTPRKKKSFLRRLVRAFSVLVFLALVILAALPSILSTSRARATILAAANRALAPSVFKASSLSVSWLGSLRLSGLSLTDKNGKTLITAQQAHIDRGLINLALDRSHLGTLTVVGASIDVERRPDGSIDLLEALLSPRPRPSATPASPSNRTPRSQLTLRVVQGSLRFKTPELAEPITAEQMDIEVDFPSEPSKSLDWKVRLANTKTASQTLGIDGSVAPNPSQPPDLSFALKAVQWPLALAASGVVLHASLDGNLKTDRIAGLWTSSGDAKLLQLDAGGPALQGDRLDFDQVSAAWDLAQSPSGYIIRRFGVVTPVGTLSASGALSATSTSALASSHSPDVRLEAKLDLAPLAKQIPHTLHLRDGLTLDHGSARIVAQIKTEGALRRASIEANLSDIVARNLSKTFTLRDPATLSAIASRDDKGARLETLAVKSHFLELSGAGDLEKGVKIAGAIDLGGLETQFRDLIDFGRLQLAGKGRIIADFRKNGPGYVGRFATEFRALKAAGLTPEPFLRDSLRFDIALAGPADFTGVPQTWERARLNLKSSHESLTLGAQLEDSTVTLNTSGALPIPTQISNRPGQADLKLLARWHLASTPLNLGAIDIDEFRLSLRPSDSSLATSGTIGVALKGSLNLDTDDLALYPLPLAPGLSAPLAVAPEGLKLHGLRKTPLAARAAAIGITGDLHAVEQALFVWTSRPPTGFAGTLKASLGLGPADGGILNLGVSLSIPDLSRPGSDNKFGRPEGPLTLVASAAYDPAADRLDSAALVLDTPYARLDAQGTINDPTRKRLADLQGTLSPNWQTLTRLLAESVEPGAKVEGNPRPFRLKGPFSGPSLATILNGLDADLGLDLTALDAFGLTLGPAPIVLRCRDGNLSVDPIETTLNNGRVSLKPGLQVDDVEGVAILLNKGSSITEAEINDEVSTRILRYIAPVLDNATHVNGKFSALFDDAEIPVTGPPTQTVSLTGEIAFHDVLFAPGPFAGQLMTLAGKSDSPGLRLDNPVQLSISNGRIHQKGLSVPISKDASVSLEGSVGFDQTLDLKATIPITKRMLGSLSGLDALVKDSKVSVPISGTLKNPRLNKQALQLALKELTKNTLKGELSRQASDLLNKISPADSPSPDAQDELIRRLLPKRKKP